MRLQRVVAAASLADLRVPPSHRLENCVVIGAANTAFASMTSGVYALSGRPQGAMEIEVTDYH